MNTGSTYHRQAAGPYDNRALRSIDSQLENRKWYKAHKGDKGYRYVPLEKAGGHKEYFDRYFGGVSSRFDEVIGMFRAAKTVQCEIVATLYAAWEDLLAQTNDVTDEQILEQVLHHWHPSKHAGDPRRDLLSFRLSHAKPVISIILRPPGLPLSRYFGRLAFLQGE